MAYVEDNLTKDEEIIFKAKIHWFIYAPATLMLMWAMLLFYWDNIGAYLVLAGSLYFIVRAIVTTLTTELAITSKRIIAKYGLARRTTIELNYSKVESVNFDQSIFGRVFGYGSILINGVGGNGVPILSIDNPIAFKKLAVETMEADQ